MSLPCIYSGQASKKENSLMIDILPKDFFVRPPTMDDLLVVHKLIEECDIAEYGEPEITLDDLRILWQSPTFNMASDAWMVIAPGDRLVGYADMEQREYARIFTFVRVIPAYADQGIG